MKTGKSGLTTFTLNVGNAATSVGHWALECSGARWNLGVWILEFGFWFIRGSDIPLRVDFGRAARCWIVACVVIFAKWEAFGAEAISGACGRLAGAFKPPAEYAHDFGGYVSPLRFADGTMAANAAQWMRRRGEILTYWTNVLGSWPPLLKSPRLTVIGTTNRIGYLEQRVRVPYSERQTSEGILLIPQGKRPFPAVLVPFYEPGTSVGRGKAGRDFGLQLVRRGFVTLSIGSPGGDAWKPELAGAQCQPLAYLAYIAANCHTALAGLEQVDGKRIGIVGHSYGGKWAMFASCLYDKFACAVWSDPGVVWDETRPNVNYWEEWYLGYVPGKHRPAGMPKAANPRTGAYRELFEHGHDLHELHVLMAPRPFLVSGGAEDPLLRWRALNHSVAINALLGATNRIAMTSRKTHDPTAESNEAICDFFECFLK